VEYKVTVTYNKADFINFAKAYQYQILPFRILSIAYKIGITLTGVSLILASINSIIFLILELITKGKTNRPFILSILLIIFVTFVIIGSNNKLLGILSWRKFNEKGSEIKYHFYDKEFTEHTPASEHKLNYSVIKRIYEDKVAYYLFIDKSHGYIISKSGFVDCDSNQFATFISEQTGLKVNQIK
jgi:hypothetical protein